MSKKITFLVFILLLIFGAGLILLSVNQKKGQKESKETQISEQLKFAETTKLINRTALIYFLPAIMQVKKGQDFSVELKVNVFEQASSGLDVVLQYDKNLLEFKEAVSAQGFNLVLPRETKENTAFSLLALPGKKFQGEVKTADLYFTALDTGTAQVSFIAEIGSTMDTNVAGPGGDILKQADGLIVNIN